MTVDQFKIIHKSDDQLLADNFTKLLERIKFTNFVKKLSLKSKNSWFFYLFIFLFHSTRLQECESSCVHVIYCCMLVIFDYATVTQLLDECLLFSWHKHSKLLWHSIFLNILLQIFVCICCFTLFLECFDLFLLSTQNSCSLIFSLCYLPLWQVLAFYRDNHSGSLNSWLDC